MKDTKQRLLKVAVTLVENEGVDQLTIRKIAERANVSVSVVHHHYKNRQGLVDACKTHFYSGVAEVVSEVLQLGADDSVEAALENATRAIWKYGREHVELLRVLAADAFAQGELVARYRDYDNRPFLAATSALLGPRLEMPTATLRFRLHTMGVLLTRCAVSTEAELKGILGDDASFETVEDELVATVRLLFHH